MQERHTNRKMYFRELALTSEQYYIPYLSRFKPITYETKVLEIGCGDGGNLLPFAKKGCYTLGVDIAECRIDDAREFFTEEHAKGEFIASDVFKLTELHGKFDIIICHDIIEHISDKHTFLSLMNLFLAEDGVAFVAFPAWQMPFGGHQQICRNKLVSHAPFVHLLPNPLYRAFLKINGIRDVRIEELLSIKDTRTSIELFERTVKKVNNLRIIDRTLWLVNPHYKAKFGLNPKKLSKSIAKIPYFRNFLSTSCFFLLSKIDS